jgi:hypothetical protein
MGCVEVGSHGVDGRSDLQQSTACHAIRRHWALGRVAMGMLVTGQWATLNGVWEGGHCV